MVTVPLHASKPPVLLTMAEVVLNEIIPPQGRNDDNTGSMSKGSRGANHSKPSSKGRGDGSPKSLSKDVFRLEEEEYDDVHEKFDLMNVQITVYSLSGLSISGNAKQVPEDTMSIPTTAVVSTRRNIVGSGQYIETYLPSSSLKKPSQGTSGHSRQTASWQGTVTPSLLEEVGESNNDCTTFNITRVMQKQSYRPEISIREVVNYMPETIEFKVGVGRGKEVISLGVASISVTGDEEGETIATVPVKVLSPDKSKRKIFGSKTGRKKRKQRAVFSGDPGWSYALYENATLRVGVRVSIHDSEKRHETWKKSKAKSLDDILEGMYDENMVIELDDENSLLQQFMGHPVEEQQQQVETEQGVPKVEKAVTFPSSIVSLFCGAIPLCAVSDNDIVPSPRNTESGQVRREIKVGSRKTEAIVLSLSLMSSVSESTFGTEIESPAFSQQKNGF